MYPEKQVITTHFPQDIVGEIRMILLEIIAFEPSEHHKLVFILVPYGKTVLAVRGEGSPWHPCTGPAVVRYRTMLTETQDLEVLLQGLLGIFLDFPESVAAIVTMGMEVYHLLCIYLCIHNGKVGTVSEIMGLCATEQACH